MSPERRLPASFPVPAFPVPAPGLLGEMVVGLDAPGVTGVPPQALSTKAAQGSRRRAAVERRGVMSCRVFHSIYDPGNAKVKNLTRPFGGKGFILRRFGPGILPHLGAESLTCCSSPSDFLQRVGKLHRFQEGSDCAAMERPPCQVVWLPDTLVKTLRNSPGVMRPSAIA